MAQKRNDDFFEERKEQSLIKASIVSKYFWIWAKVMAERTDEFYYVDLFSGPGLYEDQSESTPLLIVQNALRDQKIYRKLRLVFNDENYDYINQLQIEIEQLEDYGNLVYPPVFYNKDVSEITGRDIYPNSTGSNIPPTLMFIDPFGYNGLSLDFFEVLKYWGSEVIFFFNYKRINMALNNPVFVKNMMRIFNADIFEELKYAFRTKKLNSLQRERLITEAICKRIMRVSTEVIKPIHYRFVDEHGTRTLHHLFFATKNPLGYAKMKEVMASQSSENQEGVGMMEFNPLTKRIPHLITSYSIPLLMHDLLNTYAGSRLTVQQIYFQHNIGKPYTEKNYKEALRRLEAKAAIATTPSIGERRRIKGIVTMADSVIITFPNKVK